MADADQIQVTHSNLFTFLAHLQRKTTDSMDDMARLSNGITVPHPRRKQTFRMKKGSERRKHCALAVVRRSQKISPRRRPLPCGAGRPKFNQLEWRWSLPSPKDLQFGEDRCTQFRVIVVTDPQTNKPTNKHTKTHANRQDRLQYTAPLSLARSITSRESRLV